MAYVLFDSSYVPCGFLIVREGADPYSSKDEDSRLITLDYDYPGIAMRMGWSVSMVKHFVNIADPERVEETDCDHSGTDGSIDCKACGLAAGFFISSAYDHIYNHSDEEFPELDEYFLEG